MLKLTFKLQILSWAMTDLNSVLGPTVIGCVLDRYACFFFIASLHKVMGDNGSLHIRAHLGDTLLQQYRKTRWAILQTPRCCYHTYRFCWSFRRTSKRLYGMLSRSTRGHWSISPVLRTALGWAHPFFVVMGFELFRRPWIPKARGRVRPHIQRLWHRRLVLAGPFLLNC